MAAPSVRKSILLVEDEALIAMDKARILTDHGYDVVTVHSGKKAIEAVDAETFDLILMDINLGPERMDGTEAAQKILEKHNVPIIFHTSYSDKATVDRVKDITMYGYVLKSSGDFVLLESIRMAFSLFEAHRKTRESESKYRAAFMTSPNAVNINRLDDGTYIDINQGFTNLTGYTREDVIGIPSTEIGIWAHPEDRERLTAGLQKQGFVENLEAEFRCKDGSVKTAVMSARIIDIANRKHIVSITRDITKQKKLEQTQLQFQALFEHAYDAIFIETPDDRIIDANRMACEMMGYTKEEIRQLHVVDLQAPEVRTRNTGILKEELKNNRGNFFEGLDIRKDGTIFPIEISNASITGPEGELIITIVRDISERRKYEKQLRAALEEKESLMQELNHRVKNNLLMVSSLISLKDLEAGGKYDLSDLKHQIDAIRILHEKLKPEGNITRINVQGYFHDILSTAFESFPGSPVHCNETVEPVELETRTAIPLGLIINEIATNAMKHGFTGDIPGEFSVHFYKTPRKNEYTLQLGNSGQPFPEHITLEHPSTLGLRLVTSLVDQIGGTIELTRKPNPLFTIRFIPEA